MSFQYVCNVDDLVENSGVCVLVAGQQVALFLLGSSEQPQLFAIGNYDPIGEANVLSRGIIGSIGDRVVVASPLYKQHFCLSSGQCLQQPEVRVPVFPVAVKDLQVWVASQPLAA